MPITDLKRAVRKAYRGTPVAELADLLAEQTRWERKATIARNKLIHVRKQIVRLADRLAKQSVGISP